MIAGAMRIAAASSSLRLSWDAARRNREISCCHRNVKHGQMEADFVQCPLHRAFQTFRGIVASAYS
jgi:hypothetical protein